ncbi:leucyl aminopeptidase [Acetobacter cibinongensis]|uniref:Leucyl aminopeptidase n=1 Tax=Acetobacter cibinongensis TaxID=146475 RepID=A0A0D6N5Q4_9PROT|nr:leucyl aminopeptidase family protein [Acetobacter cibinongensis]GAN61040.1 leucyl aminopeptidase [Acetobacter cibinongensis]GBQ12904.1 leucyl aminopeptidase [Acetobacter cibinongensis NRIC 0482]GEL58463.1 leucyl aminopeptidase [Acetobacter cibinongensis]
MPVQDAECLSVLRRNQKKAHTVYAVRAPDIARLKTHLGPTGVAFVQACGFTGEPGDIALVPDTAGQLSAVFGIAPVGVKDPYQFGALAGKLPPGNWQVHAPDDVERDDVVLGFCLGSYQFSLKASATEQTAKPKLVVMEEEKTGRAVETARSIWLARDLINTPANLLGPTELAHAARDALAPLGAEVEIIKGKALDKAYPLLAHVGNGSDRGPRVAIARWRGSKAGKKAPLISLVGKGVCFDSGGYDIKPSAGMLRMKKDMGGAASVLALARMIMTQDLPIQLEVRLGCVENSVSGHAMRPLDVVKSRAGLTVEIGNTDAEGRLVLCDLLAEAGETTPDLLLDMATLTGAARVALGPDLPGLFCNDEGVAEALLAVSHAQADPLWRLPLWQGYAGWLSSSVADLNNISSKPMAGAVTAGLFLERFVKAGQRWAHIDTYAWNDSSRPGRPEGGDSPGVRAVFAMLEKLFANQNGADA